MLFSKLLTFKYTFYAFLRKIAISLNLRFLTNISDNNQKNRILKVLKKRFPNLDLNSNSIVIDLGSNRGRFSLAVSNFGAKVFAFEPNFEAFIYSRIKLKKFQNVSIFNVAISNQSGLIKLYHHLNYSKDPLGYSVSSSLLSEKSNVSNTDFALVPTIDINEIFKEFDRIDLLKIDVEGSERLLWKAIQENFMKIEYLIIENHDDRLENHSDWVKNARFFIEEHNLEAKWRLDWE